MKYLLAFDKFKGSLSASEACEIAENAIQQIDVNASIQSSPLTDGGEGFCEIVTTALGGVKRNYQVTYPDLSTGNSVIGYAFIDKLSDKIKSLLNLPDNGLLAIIEMAQAAGHQLVSDSTRDPWLYSTYGVGEMIRYAHAEGATSFLLGMGGSATNDMGVGLLESFGLKALDAEKEIIKKIRPADWSKIQSFEAPATLHNLTVRIACDVRNPLHGDDGAAAVFGKQKGLSVEDLPGMQKQMIRIDQLLRKALPSNNVNCKAPGMGAAGGLPFGLSIAFETQLVPGFELICEILQLDRKIEEADIILTGEGALDKSSLSGKGPYEIIKQGLDHQKQVCVFSGKVFDEAREALLEINDKIQVNQVGSDLMTVDENIKNEKLNLKNRIIESLPELFS